MELKDGRKLQVKMPMKKTFSKLSVLKDMQQAEDVSIEDVIDTLGAVVAECLSHNLNGETVTTEYIVDNYDIEDMKEFIDQYYEKFVAGIASDPN